MIRQLSPWVRPKDSSYFVQDDCILSAFGFFWEEKSGVNRSHKHGGFCLGKRAYSLLLGWEIEGADA